MRLTAITKALCVLLLSTLAAASCSDSNTSATSPTVVSPTQSVTIDVYAGPIDPGGSSRYLATLEADMALEVMLAGEQLADPIRTVSVPLKIEISSWDGSDCTVIEDNVTAPRLTAQLHRYMKAGTYCVRVSDPGTLTETIGAVLRIAYPAPSRVQGTNSPATLSSVVTPGGVVTKSFTTSSEGTINITLNSLSASGTIKLGIGVLSSSSNACSLTKIVEVRPGSTPQISEHADTGIYCAAVLDPGTLTGVTNFSMTIEHP